LSFDADGGVGLRTVGAVKQKFSRVQKSDKNI